MAILIFFDGLVPQALGACGKSHTMALAMLRFILFPNATMDSVYGLVIPDGDELISTTIFEPMKLVLILDDHVLTQQLFPLEVPLPAHTTLRYSVAVRTQSQAFTARLSAT